MPPHLFLFALITFCWTRLFFGFKNTLQFLLAMYSSIRVVLKLREIIHQAIYKPITVKTFATRPSTYSDVRYVSPKSRLTPVSSLYLEDLKFNWFWSQLKLATRFHAGFLGFGKVQIRKPETFSCCCKKKEYNSWRSWRMGIPKIDEDLMMMMMMTMIMMTMMMIPNRSIYALYI